MPQHQNKKEAEKQYEFLEHIRRALFKLRALTWQMVVMWGIGALLIYLAIVKKMEPSLLLPMGFGAILVNLPASGAITQGDTVGPISALFEAGGCPTSCSRCCCSSASVP